MFDDIAIEAAMAPGERAAYANGYAAAGVEIDALRAKVTRPRAVLAWIEDHDPQLVEAARTRFGTGVD
jgi:hypothetical protein